MKEMKGLLASITNILMILYPFLVYVGLNHFEPRLLALLLCLILALRLLSGKQPGLLPPRYHLLLVLAAVVLVMLTLLGNVSWGLKLYPVVVNLGFLGLFTWSLYYPPSMIERLARLREPELPARAIIYTRRVTQLWCLFFAINGGLALYTAFWASVAAWTLYNGLIAYLLIGGLLAGEYLFRRYWLEKQE